MLHVSNASDLNIREHQRSSMLGSGYDHLGARGLATRSSDDSSPRRHIDSSHKQTSFTQHNARPHNSTAADHQDVSSTPRPTQAALLRDLPFVLQGLSSTLFEFNDELGLNLPLNLPVPVLSLLHTLAEPALLYRSLNEYTKLDDGGLTVQGLRAAVAVELRSYLGLIATLEHQIRASSDPQNGEEEHESSVTLKRCVLWLREATLGLRLMDAIVQDTKGQGKKGGEIISLVHGFVTLHGDPFIQTFAKRLLAAITQPFYQMLRKWIYSGELDDPYLDFFVCEQADAVTAHIDQSRTLGSSVWETKYILQSSMIPSIVTHEFAQRVFLIGKSLNFIRYTCNDSSWVEEYSNECYSRPEGSDDASLAASVEDAYTKTMAHLLHLMADKFKLYDHLSALKKYLLLGQGDFIALLMESLASNLDRPANNQYRHTLTAQLEHAIRNSNAQFESPDVLKRLDARMLELSHGEIGWDVFTLEYRIDSPLDVIITPWASRQYLKVFNFLWRVKRVEFAIEQTFRKCTTGARGVLRSVDQSLERDWKAARLGMAAMIHFLCQLQYYILFEVIEASWEGLQAAIRKPGATLDTLIAAHNDYLRSITRKGLLSSSSTSGGPSTMFTIQLHELLKLILNYKDAVEVLYSNSVAAFTERQNSLRRVDRTNALDQEDVGSADVEMADPDDITIPDLIPRSGNEKTPSGRSTSATQGQSSTARARGVLEALDIDFRERVSVFLYDLAHRPETDMRFLGVVMNFNGVYKPTRPRR